MTTKDLRWKDVREFRSEPTGDYRINRNGRRVPVTEGAEYINTVAAGRMKIEDWYHAMEQAVIQEGKTELLDKLIEYCQKLAWIRTEKAAKEHALECLSSEAYKAWNDFR